MGFLCLGRAHRAVPLLQMYRWIWDTSRSAFPVILDLVSCSFSEVMHT